MDQAMQVFGSLSVLAAFVAAQLGATSTKSRIHLALNLAGSTVLTIAAAVAYQAPARRGATALSTPSCEWAAARSPIFAMATSSPSRSVAVVPTRVDLNAV